MNFQVISPRSHSTIRIQSSSPRLTWKISVLSVFSLTSQFFRIIPPFSAAISSKQWQKRQSRDKFAISAKVQGLKSRAAYKLLEIHEKHGIFREGQIVVDLGYAPGSWSQVALEKTSPNGHVIGIDIIPAQPPRGVSTIQGNFLSPAVQDEAKKFLRQCGSAMPQVSQDLLHRDGQTQSSESSIAQDAGAYFEFERRAKGQANSWKSTDSSHINDMEKASRDDMEQMVDVVLSDMSAPWEQTEGFWKRSLSDPYFRMMNTTGAGFKDHVGSMDLCHAALKFGFDTLRNGGHFVCKFYQGAEDKLLENQLRALFSKVYREKPESSRSSSKEAYFVALCRKRNIDRTTIFSDLHSS